MASQKEPENGQNANDQTYRPAQFNTLAVEAYNFGENNFIEVALKNAAVQGEPPEAAIEFIQLSRGYYNRRGERKWKIHLTVPRDPKLLAWIADQLRGLA